MPAYQRVTRESEQKAQTPQQPWWQKRQDAAPAPPRWLLHPPMPFAPPARAPAPLPAPAKAPAPAPAKAAVTAAVKAAAPAPTARLATPAAPSDLAWLPAVVQQRASAYAHEFAGFPLLTLLLGHDPFTGRGVARSPQALTAGVLALAPGGPAFFQTLRQSGVLPAAAELLTHTAQRHGLSLARVQQTLAQARAGYEQASVWHPLAGFHRVVDPFEHLAQDVHAFAAEVLEPLLELVFTRLAGPQAKRVLTLLKQAGHTYRTIMADPVAFLGHLVSAARLGFAGFTERATTHLQQGLSEWILGPLGKLNLVLPTRFDAAGVLTLGLQVLELTYPQLRPKLVDRFGQPLVHALETGAGVLHTLAKQGVKAAGQELYALAQDLVGQLREQVESGVRAWVAKTLLGRLVVELAKLLVPASAIISAIEKVYTTVLFFVEKAGKFQALVATIVGALPAIAAGQVGAAAGEVEKTLGRLVPLALGFVADFIGLGGLTDAVRAQLQKARDWVQKIIQRLIEKVGKLVGKGQAKTSAQFPATARPDMRTLAQKQASLQSALAAGTRLLYDTRLPDASLARQLVLLQRQHQLTALTLVRDNTSAGTETVHLHGAINPEQDGPQVTRPSQDAAKQDPVTTTLTEQAQREAALLQQLRQKQGKAPVQPRAANAYQETRIKQIREEFKIKKDQNIAYTEGTIDGKPYEVVSHSGYLKEKENTVGHTPVEEQQLTTHPTSSDIEQAARRGEPVNLKRRAYDSETKILEDLLRKTTPASKGDLKLVSELPVCDSCHGALRQFQQLRPGIRIRVWHDTK